MKVLFIWHGLHRALPPRRKACIDACLALYPDAEYFCISAAPDFVSPRIQVLPWNDCLEEMRSWLGLNEAPVPWRNYLPFSDWARMWFLRHNPGTLYLDTDTTVLKAYPFENEEKFVFPERGEICLIYAPQRDLGNALEGEVMRVAKRNPGTLLVGEIPRGPERFAWSKTLTREYFHHWA